MIPAEGLPILTMQEMRDAEARAIAAGASVDSLMADAGGAVAEQIRRLAAGAEALILCGPGNNGGDGYAAASVLRGAGHHVRVAAISEPRTLAARAAAERWGGPVEALGAAGQAPIIIDALFGVGLTRPLGANEAAALRRLRGLASLAMAVDVPSGVVTDTGVVLGDIPAFDITLALGAVKPAHVLQPAAGLCGAVRVLDIGVAVDGAVRVLDRPTLRAPDAEAHKYSRGMVAVVAGVMPGAACLAATAAAHAGAGYVLLLGSATDRLAHAIVRRRFAPEVLSDERIGAIVIGPGLGRDDRSRERLGASLQSGRPLVIDGDALRLLDGHEFDGRAVLTPHAGEFAAMFGDVTTADTGEGKIALARRAARQANAIIVFKGADTVIAAPDGRANVCCGAPTWLSTAGTGDVLAGVIAARLAAGARPFEAASQGVWLHAEAARQCGPAFVADDLTRHLPGAIGQCL